MRKDGYLTNLAEWLKQNPRKPDQSDEQRALEVYKAGIEDFDRLDARERALREAQARILEDSRFYALLSLKTRDAFIVLVKDFEAFCALYKLKPADALKVAMGEEREHRGFVRWNNVGAMGRPYKPPRPKEVDDEMARLRKEADAEQKRLDRLNQERYELPPVQRTIHFVPTNK